MRLDERSPVTHHSRRMMCLVSIFILETHNETNKKFLPLEVHLGR